jgi:hypothetical protein
MSRRRKILTIAGIWLGVGLVVALALVAHPPTAGASGAQGARPCNVSGSHICNGDRYVVISTYRRSAAGMSSTVERMGPRRARQAFYGAPGTVCVDTIQRAGGRVVHPGVCHR